MAVEAAPGRIAAPRALGLVSPTLIVAVLGLALIVAAPHVLYPVFVMKVLCFALFACAFNLLLGYVGLLSFGHALYFGGAAYICAHLAKHGLAFSLLGMQVALPPFTPELAILAGTAFSAIMGTLVGYLAIRRQGIYFAMITLALAQMFYFFCLQAPFTGGEDGIQGVPRGALFGIIYLDKPLTMYYFVAAVFIFGFVAIWRIVNSPFGNILKAIRENEPRAISLGYRVDRYKLAAFVISAALAGMAGATKAIVFQLASLTDVDWPMSGEVVLMTLLGGIGTMLGPVVGAALVVTLQNYLAASVFPVPVVTGTIFVICVMIFRRGIVGEINALLTRRR